MLPIERILETTLSVPVDRAIDLGRSRQGRRLLGYRSGNGPCRVSAIAGCHADEPVGPAMLERLVAYLGGLPPEDPLLTELSWSLVPHVNPDGEARNAPWTRHVFPEGVSEIAGATAASAIDLGGYLRHVIRELPGDDIEFGFPRDAGDDGARPENLAVAEFLRADGPFAVHASFHGMAFAAGPWFLIEHSWADRTVELRQRLRRRVTELGYRAHDVDRGGEKGFHRIDEGFTSRPDSRAMAAHFESLDDSATAALFRPSSMEYVRSQGGDPLTLVSEMPLFVVPAELYESGPRTPASVQALAGLVADRAELDRRAQQLGVRPMPIDDQMRLQLEYLDAAIEAAC